MVPGHPAGRGQVGLVSRLIPQLVPGGGAGDGTGVAAGAFLGAFVAGRTAAGIASLARTLLADDDIGVFAEDAMRAVGKAIDTDIEGCPFGVSPDLQSRLAQQASLSDTR